MVLPTVLYDATSGSDTAASGAGPATAKTGTNADGATTTITLNETVDFTGVADDGSDVFFSEANAVGDRHLFPISSFNPSVVAATTLTVTVAVSASWTAKNWAVGGKRKTFENTTANKDWEDWLGGWTIHLDGDFAITEVMVPIGGTTAEGPTVIKGIGAAKSEISVGTGAHAVMSTASLASTASLHSRFENLIFDTLTATGDMIGIEGLGVTTHFGDITLSNCDFNTKGGCIVLTVARRRDWIIQDCLFKSTNQIGFNSPGDLDACLVYVLDSRFEDCVTVGFRLNGLAGHANVVVENSIFVGTTGAGHGLQTSLAGYGTFSIINSTFVDNAGDGLLLPADAGANMAIANRGNVFYNNGGYGINSAGTDTAFRLIGPNAYGSNTSGAHNGITGHADDVTLTADPFKDRTGTPPNLGLNEVEGGGLLIRHSAPELES